MAILEEIVRPIEDFCCQNPDCPDAGKKGKGNLRFHGSRGCYEKIRGIFCKTCHAYFSERTGTVLQNSHLPLETAISILEHLREGVGMRATARLVGVNKNTVQRYARIAGDHAQALHDELVKLSPPDPRSST
jgi:transposase-like protein